MCCKINYLEGSKKYIVNVYKTVQRLRVHFLYDYWLCSVSSYVLRKRNKMPKIKGKIYKPRGFDSIKNTTGESWLCVPLWQAGGRRSWPSHSTASQPQSEACGCQQLHGKRTAARMALSLPSNLKVTVCEEWTP